MLLFLAQALDAAKLHRFSFSPHEIQRHLSNRFGSINSVVPKLISTYERKILADDCPETPFLWKIVENESGNHVGFGLGTMHLPAELVLSDDAYFTIFNAIEDSCNIYGEVNLIDPIVQSELEECMKPFAKNAATISDIADEDVKAAYEAKLLEIAGKVTVDELIVDAIYQALLPLPLFLVQQFITFSNTPEYEPFLVQTLTGTPVQPLDESILSVGRVAGGVEEISTQCDLLEELYVPPEKLDTESLLIGLNASLSEQIDLYKCGDIDTFSASQESSFESEFEGNSEFEQQILDERNIQMAAAMADILKTSDEKALFAFGFLHWIYGDKSLEILLSDYGYSLELVPTYGADDAENRSNEQCGVEWNTTSGVFELTETVSTDAPVVLQSNSTTASSTPNISVTSSPIASPVSVSDDGSDEMSTATPASEDNSGKDTEIHNSSRMVSPAFVSALCILAHLYY